MNTKDFNDLNDRIRTELEIIQRDNGVEIPLKHYQELVLFKLINEISNNNEEGIKKYICEFKYMSNLDEGSNKKVDDKIDDEIKDLLSELYDSKNQLLDYYHYTDLNGVLGIFHNYIVCDRIENKAIRNCCIKANDIRYLNDSKEYLEGKKALETLINKCETKFKNNELPDWGKLLNEEKELKNDKPESLYNISFCGDGDLLSQWEYYGKDSGVAIKFNFKDAYCFIGDAINPKDIKKIIEDSDFYFDKANPIPVGYTTLEKNRLFIGSCFISENYEMYPSKDIIPYCKNEMFKEEKESRLIFRIDGNIHSSVKQPVWDYSISEGKIKPFIPIQFFTKEGNIIESLTVGPGINQHLIFNALIHIFDGESKFENETAEEHECQSGIKIKKSKIPFRG